MRCAIARLNLLLVLLKLPDGRMIVPLRVLARSSWEWEGCGLANIAG